MTGHFSKKETKMIDWIKSRLKERSSIDGVIFIAAGVAFIVIGPLAKFVAYGAVLYGLYTIIRSE